MSGRAAKRAARTSRILDGMLNGKGSPVGRRERERLRRRGAAGDVARWQDHPERSDLKRERTDAPALPAKEKTG